MVHGVALSNVRGVIVTFLHEDFDEVFDVTPPGWVRDVDALDSSRKVHALFYGDGTVRIQHQCKIVDRVQIVCAPSLQLGNGHTIVCDDPLTVTASIACPDCRLHGWITDGRWLGC
jgi:hypothetical protein